MSWLYVTLFGVFLMFSGYVRSQEVSIFTDKDDYWPGEWVIIQGSGWQGNDSVMITLEHIEPNIPAHTHAPWYLIPDASGNVYYEWFVEDQELGTTFHLIAEGMINGLLTGVKAEDWFTDSPAINSSVAVSPLSQSSCIPASGTVTVSYTVTAIRSANRTINGIYSVSGLPAGVSGAFSQATFTANGNTAFPSSTLTLTISSTAVAAVTNFTVTCADGSDQGTGTGTLDLNSAPGIICPVEIKVNNTTGQCGAIVSFSASATGASSPVSYSHAPGSFFPVGTTTVTASATNSCGTSTCQFNVIVTDNEAPVILVSNVAVDNDPGTCGAAVSLEASATDNCTVGAPTNNWTGGAFPVGTTTVIWNVTDINGNPATATQLVTVTDSEKPVAVCQDVTVQLNAFGNGSTTAAAVNNGSTDNCGILSLSLDKTSFTCADFGPNPVTLTVTDVHGNFSTCTAVVKVLGRPEITLQPQSTEIVYGCDAPLLSVTATLEGTGILTYKWYKNSTNSPTGGIPIPGANSSTYQTPHNYSVGNYYYYVVVTANSCPVISEVATVSIVPQTADAVGDIYYTGPTMAWTTSPTSNTATVTLAATIKNSLPCGDIRTALVTFTVNGVRIPSATNLPVNFIDPNYPEKGGTASAIVQLNISANTTSEIFDIGVILSGNYTNGSLVPGEVTIIKPKPGGVIAGGALLCNNNSTGFIKGLGLSYLNFFVEYTMKGKSATNPKGKVYLTVVSRNKPDGTVDNKLHFYSIKSTAIASLNFKSSTEATFSAKANVTEIFPMSGISSAIEGNCVMVLDLKDVNTTGKPNFADMTGITIQRNNGGIWYSNNWVNTNTALATICGGDISVTGSGSNPDAVAKSAVIELPQTGLKTSLSVYPNPFSDVLQFGFLSPSDGSARIDLFDLTGRLVQTVFNQQVKAGSEYNAEFRPDAQVNGMYIYRMTLGNEVFNGKVTYRK